MNVKVWDNLEHRRALTAPVEDRVEISMAFLKKHFLTIVYVILVLAESKLCQQIYKDTHKSSLAVLHISKFFCPSLCEILSGWIKLNIFSFQVFSNLIHKSKNGSILSNIKFAQISLL